MVLVLVYNTGHRLHTPIIHAHVHEGGNEAGRKRQLHPTEQFQSIVFYCGDCEGYWVVMYEFAGLKAS